MKNFMKLAAIIAAVTSIFACNKINEPQMNEAERPDVPMTKAIGDKSPIMVGYVETNDVNPLNAGDYYFSDDFRTFFDIVELFASNIHKEVVGGEERPTLYLNDKLANILENGGVEKYVRPLQELGIKVLLTNLGDWQHIGLANMTDTQADQFATILAAVVKHYGLDGIGFDDEYADYYSTNGTSYTRIITRLHELMNDPNKLITVFDWGNTHTIDQSVACPCIDYVYHGNFGSWFYGTPGLCTKEKWSPISLNLGNYNSVSSAKSNAARAATEGYGAMMCFNLRTRNDNDPLPIFQGLSDGAYGGKEVACDDGNRSRDVVIDPDGFTITYDMALTWLAE